MDVNDSQTKDAVIKDERIGNYGNGVQITGNRNDPMSNSGSESFSTGCKQGRIDGFGKLNSSRNNASDKSKKKM